MELNRYDAKEPVGSELSTVNIPCAICDCTGRVWDADTEINCVKCKGRGFHQVKLNKLTGLIVLPVERKENNFKRFLSWFIS